MSASVATEEILIIETPERVPLHFALASIGNRFLACALDHTIQGLVLVLIFVTGLIIANASSATLETAVFSAPKWVYAVMIILIFLTFSGYFAFFEWLWSGQTPGKRWMKLRVIREDGRPITFWEAAVRNLIRTLDMMPAPFYSIGLISVFVTGRDQRVGDMVAGTVVVREREAEAPAFTAVFASPVSDPALRRSFKPVDFTANLNSLTEAEIQVVETFLRRRWDLPDVPRQWMAWRVALPILFKIRPTYDLATFTYEGFLEELLHRYLRDHRFSA
ncbi:MAG: RDD family protein [Acidobacteria bacterium]|nr:RDD family protein [Acidobacteriota bacterium]MCA1627908.1 RDD family protein [Acidobacteriota bacterium]